MGIEILRSRSSPDTAGLDQHFIRANPELVVVQGRFSSDSENSEPSPDDHESSSPDDALIAEVQVGSVRWVTTSRVVRLVQRLEKPVPIESVLGDGSVSSCELKRLILD